MEARPPSEDVYKINCDAAYIPGLHKSGREFVIRNHSGDVVAARPSSADFLIYICQTCQNHCLYERPGVCYDVRVRGETGHCGN